MNGISNWWCDDLSIILTIVGLVASILGNIWSLYRSRQVKISVIGDVSHTDKTEIQVTISNVGIINARLGKIGIGYLAKKDWYKTKEDFECLFTPEYLNFNPILAAGETIRIKLKLDRLISHLLNVSKDAENYEKLMNYELFGWLYLSRDGTTKIAPIGSEEYINIQEEELNCPLGKKFEINFSADLETTLLNCISHFAK
jgi:hypothetical protein